MPTVVDERFLLLRAPVISGGGAGGGEEEEGEIHPWRPDGHPPALLPHPPQLQAPFDPLGSLVSENPRRLASLDVFRGLTVAVMILVDDAGGEFPSINHAPWFGVTIADFVMPSFLFSVGVAIALVFKKTSDKLIPTRRIVIRTINLFLLGVLLQGGYFHGRGDFTYGVDLDRIRWFGVLQRISIGYFLAAISEVWFKSNTLVDSPISFVRKYYIQWIAAILLSSVYLGLLYGLFVPNWSFEVSGSNPALLPSVNEVRTANVRCEVRGSLGPPCNAVGLIDRLIVGEKHLYNHPVYRRTKDCSVNSPDYGPPPPDAPEWCLAPFDPEGILSSLMAAISCYVGLHFGHVIVHLKSHAQRILVWSISSLALIICGFAFQILGMPFSKPLYTLSYMFLTSGASGFLLTLIYYLVDIKDFGRAFAPLQWLGMNALIVYALAASELLAVAIQGFYWRSTENNMVDATESFLQAVFRSEKLGTFAFVLLEIVFWCAAAGYLHMRKIYFKL